jgi:hypothetical protein
MFHTRSVERYIYGITQIKFRAATIGRHYQIEVCVYIFRECRVFSYEHRFNESFKFFEGLLPHKG